MMSLEDAPLFGGRPWQSKSNSLNARYSSKKILAIIAGLQCDDDGVWHWRAEVDIANPGISYCHVLCMGIAVAKALVAGKISSDNRVSSCSYCSNRHVFAVAEGALYR